MDLALNGQITVSLDQLSYCVNRKSAMSNLRDEIAGDVSFRQQIAILVLSPLFFT